MSFHYVVNAAYAAKGQPWIGLRKVAIPNELVKVFLEPYIPHRPRWAERRFKKRVRIYIERGKLPKPEKVVKEIVEEEWWTASVSYTSAEDWNIDASVTIQGTEEEAVKALKKLLLDEHGVRLEWWTDNSLFDGMAYIGTEKAVDEVKWKEMKIVDFCFSHKSRPIKNPKYA